MYHFVKIRFCRENKSYWYLKPECPQDIVEHFQKIVAKDIAMGTCERINSEYIFKTQDGSLIRGYSKDYNTDWNLTVSRINYIFGLIITAFPQSMNITKFSCKHFICLRA